MRLIPPGSDDDNERKKRPRPLSHKPPLAIGTGNRCLRVPGSCVSDQEAHRFTLAVNAQRDDMNAKLLVAGGSFLFLLLLVVANEAWFGRRRAVVARPWLGIVLLLLTLGISPWFDHLSLPEAVFSSLLATVCIIALRRMPVETTRITPETAARPEDHSRADDSREDTGEARRWTRSMATLRRGEQKLPAQRRLVATRAPQKEDGVAAPAEERAATGTATGGGNNDDRSINDGWLARSPRSPLIRTPAKRPRTKPGIRAQKYSAAAAGSVNGDGDGGGGMGKGKAAAAISAKRGGAKRGGGGDKRRTGGARSI